MKSTLRLVATFFLFHILLCSTPSPAYAAGGGGQWQLLQKSIGIVSMHMQLLSNDRVVIYDRTDFGRSNLSLPNGRCRENPAELAVQVDCTAHSVEYDVASNTFRALFVHTDVWCSSGAVAPDGRLIQTGGFNDGDRAVRIYEPCHNCDWEEVGSVLGASRWYATNHILPDGRQIIMGGRLEFNYEFYPKTAAAKQVYTLPFLAQTTEQQGVENNLYPFVFLNVDGNLFIFANNRSILFDYNNNRVVREYPVIPGGDPRTYPSTGSAVLLPFKNLQAPNVEAEVLLCGGAPRGAFQNAIGTRSFVGALNTCGRLKITDPNPQWVMENMPGPRVMGDMLLLPNGNVLILNGGAVGTAGWELGRNPVMNPFLYRPNNPIKSRFELQNPNRIPRMYHSTAILLRDGRVLVGGSNPHFGYSFSNVLFPTELSLEAFSPSYLDARFASVRPKIVAPKSPSELKYAQKLKVQFLVTGSVVSDLVSVTMFAPPFNTHSFSMSQRILVVGTGNVANLGKSTYEIEVTTPGSGILAPPGYYLLFVVHQEIPSEGIWVHLI
ncbi:Galactose oxidase [Quillaja saponaria]|uniref:Aldehyde oxidase GLOX n=1 Tax=Quillaja saponaria TaxID=32244 RepID=A0AAD7PJF3_QUISA|nr:Galactose oxidase [Quillaja saponaria]